ncbi:MAG: hypothetical protein L3J81_03410 [Thermoplasmata archaeon]|nr:hypothetical protein [Thermoplasmata archaeon]
MLRADVEEAREGEFRFDLALALEGGGEIRSTGGPYPARAAAHDAMWEMIRAATRGGPARAPDVDPVDLMAALRGIALRGGVLILDWASEYDVLECNDGLTEADASSVLELAAQRLERYDDKISGERDEFFEEIVAELSGEALCEECGGRAFVDGVGVSHHSDDDSHDGIDHEMDLDHVAIVPEHLNPGGAEMRGWPGPTPGAPEDEIPF